MATKKAEQESGDVMGEETEPFAGEEDADQPGVPGQIQYPDVEVDAEQAAAFAGGKADTLYPEGDPRNEGWSNPADTRTDAQKAEEAEQDDEGDE